MTGTGQLYTLFAVTAVHVLNESASTETEPLVVASVTLTVHVRVTLAYVGLGPEFLRRSRETTIWLTRRSRVSLLTAKPMFWRKSTVTVVSIELSVPAAVTTARFVGAAEAVKASEVLAQSRPALIVNGKSRTRPVRGRKLLRNNKRRPCDRGGPRGVGWRQRILRIDERNAHTACSERRGSHVRHRNPRNNGCPGNDSACRAHRNRAQAEIHLRLDVLVECRCGESSVAVDVLVRSRQTDCRRCSCTSGGESGLVDLERELCTARRKRVECGAAGARGLHPGCIDNNGGRARKVKTGHRDELQPLLVCE
eukprot:Opistho-2@93655